MNSAIEIPQPIATTDMLKAYKEIEKVIRKWTDIPETSYVVNTSTPIFSAVGDYAVLRIRSGLHGVWLERLPLRYQVNGSVQFTTEDVLQQVRLALGVTLPTPQTPPTPSAAEPSLADALRIYVDSGETEIGKVFGRVPGSYDAMTKLTELLDDLRIDTVSPLADNFVRGFLTGLMELKKEVPDNKPSIKELTAMAESRINEIVGEGIKVCSSQQVSMTAIFDVERISKIVPFLQTQSREIIKQLLLNHSPTPRVHMPYDDMMVWELANILQNEHRVLFLEAQLEYRSNNK